jgi:hypothetical protein
MTTMAKKKRSPLTPELRARFAETMRLLEARIAHYDRKIAERDASSSQS